MIVGRLSYILRETWASFRRNVTLTVAAIITAAVALLIFGLTLFIQRGFDNLLVQWQEDVEVIVFVRPDADADQQAEIKAALDEQVPAVIESYTFCDVACSLEQADVLFKEDPQTRQLINESNVGTQYQVIPTDASDIDELRSLSASWQTLPSVARVVFAEDQLNVISKLESFVSLYTLILSVVLLIAAILLIWNTIRTAMYARRREIEVMKLVGATDWFIRVPFMLEGLIQGLLGSLVACGGLAIINNRWTAGLKDFPSDSAFVSMYVDSGFALSRMIWLVIIGMLAGAIGAGIAASRFLDV
ncbi:cell division protein FtsX [Desertimonas flava]|uniref:cell division protein FtsX n=1 Tax=Desertimonas flava TaxID=2064846 RepID=UPI000E34E5F7|nr:FtsX-like permease family protein [Desertimonas flava]